MGYTHAAIDHALAATASEGTLRALQIHLYSNNRLQPALGADLASQSQLIPAVARLLSSRFDDPSSDPRDPARASARGGPLRGELKLATVVGGALAGSGDGRPSGHTDDEGVVVVFLTPSQAGVGY
jgi:hypothetical protein